MPAAGESRSMKNPTFNQVYLLPILFAPALLFRPSAKPVLASRTASRVLTFFITILTASCAAIIPSLDRQRVADGIAAVGGFHSEDVTTHTFKLRTYHRLSEVRGPLVVYIEGDGQAWLSTRRLSADPTPVDPVALRLAALDPSTNVLYIARPCQYVDDPGCHPRYWSSHRFSEEVIASVAEAIEKLRARVGSARLHLIGYSGGGAVASLIAARSRHVVDLRTVAGNLDHAILNRHYGVSPLTGSLNPADRAAELAHIPQQHFVGRQDMTVPEFVAESFADKSGDGRCIEISVIDGATHGDGWTERWRSLLSLPVTCRRQTGRQRPGESMLVRRPEKH